MKIFFITILILTVSCESSVKKESKDTQNGKELIQKGNKTDTLKLTGIIDKEIQVELTQIITNYYKDLYSKGFQVEERREKGTIELIFYKIPTKNEPYNGWAWSMNIPQNIILGDLNNDGAKDAIVDVIKGGGGTGGNFEENELFYFENSDDKFELKEVIMAKKLSNCGNGFFLPERIENNMVIGSSICYKNSDPTCCPSISFITKLSYTNNEFIIVKAK